MECMSELPDILTNLIEYVYIYNIYIYIDRCNVTQLDGNGNQWEWKSMGMEINGTGTEGNGMEGNGMECGQCDVT